MKRGLLFSAVLASFVASCVSVPYEEGQIRIQPAPLPGRPAPDFAIDSPDLPGVEKLSDLRGQVVLVNFWASWCVFCQRELPALESIYQSYRDQGFVVVGVNVEEGWDEVEAFREEFPFSFPITLDSDAQTFRAYWGTGIPGTFIIDRNGFVVFVRLGEIDEETIVAVLTEMGFKNP
ncbi:hypothetical protein A2890_01220 [candidate division WWE3 bacterium RIFCSPLOWO2_01_FULL_53_14]|uniref:Thioredoxin domain-containing protein n=1 Tax=candidate division WWE3 bacterium RIFCSPLOWO2_01_FULL_53_14 TaxID=1802628 RepID=A0A1F4VSB5_UNCKA|nr:MAG: hypothetical protein A2890_01220 [candidate division WWE3 bacterium RIFCSPLOWO2_01_FULL_53_14]